MTVKVCVLGPSGRMGRAVLDAAKDVPGVSIVAAVDRPGASGLDTACLPGLVATSDLAGGLAACDVYVDFTSPDATLAAARAALAAKKAAVIGTTGELDGKALAELAMVAPVIVSANFSLGVNLLLGLVRQAAKAVADWDAEVVETHHNKKKDAPSGTALMIARAIATARGVDYDQVKRHARDGDIGPRPAGEIGVSTVRGGDVVGEHIATLFGPAERLEIAHKASSRAIFALGALRAAAWAVGKPPGRYDMLDVLGLK